MAKQLTNDQLQQAVLGGGCFWCLEAVYQRVKGVKEVLSGYAGGEEDNPDYEHIGSHAEVVQITFDPHIIPFEDILEIFWTIHDPTTPNRQGNDVGTQYRSIILYNSSEQKMQADASLRSVAQPLWDKPIVTEVRALKKFYPAEEYHQNYFNNHPEAAYCQVVINPKLAKLNEKFASRLK